jgi:hypothetical protein
VMGRWGRRRKQLPKDLQENRGYWKLKEQALAHTLWRTRFGRGNGSLLTQTTKWIQDVRTKHNYCNQLVMSEKYQSVLKLSVTRAFKRNYNLEFT